MRARATAIGVVVLLAAGCAEESAPAACLPPSRVVAGACLEPGVQDDGCPAGTLGQPHGSCRSAGLPPELCAEGFEPDGASYTMILRPD